MVTVILIHDVLLVAFESVFSASLAGKASRGLLIAIGVSGCLRTLAYPGWFRVYSLATIAVVIGFGMASSFAIQGIEQTDTPWAGGFQRINAYAYFAWLIVLAVTVMRRELPTTRSSSERVVRV